ncbi:hypothetical protein [Proteus mirabilis]|uniref:hypothetical protein n=1 Tax=Proteus mirabilis TaxID=584 RepID=UPI0013D25B1A|nr:hypothetical protein [Proteus mirabilis]EKT8674121.1 hypothetical protein [Proteus mirabilis]MBG3128108.1 hypothetical protein [Proteus mirabilis]
MNVSNPLRLQFTDAFGNVCFTAFCYNLNQLSGAVQEAAQRDAQKLVSIDVMEPEGSNTLSTYSCSLIVGPTGAEQSNLYKQVLQAAKSNLNWPQNYMPASATDKELENLGIQIAGGVAALVIVQIGGKAVKMILRKLTGVPAPAVVDGNDPTPPESAGDVIGTVSDPDPEGLLPEGGDDGGYPENSGEDGGDGGDGDGGDDGGFDPDIPDIPDVFEKKD